MVAPVVMWAGRGAVQGPGVGRRPSPGRHVHGRVVRGARGGASLGLGAPWTGRAGGSLGARSRWRGSGGLPGHVARNGRGQSQSLRILGAGVRREAPHPFASGRRLPLHPDGPPATATRTVVRRFGSEESAPRPGGCVLSAQCSRTRSACRGARSANGLTVARGVGVAHVFSPSWSKSINSFSVVAPVVMWAGRRAVQGPGVGRRPSPGRHVHGRACSRSAWWCVVGSRRSLDGVGRQVPGARSGWRGSVGPARSRGEKQARVNPSRCGSSAQASRPGGPTPFASGGIAPNRTVHRDATEVVSFVARSAPRPGGCVLSRLMRSNPLRLSRSAFCARAHSRSPSARSGPG